MDHIPLPKVPSNKVVQIPYLLSQFPDLKYSHVGDGESFSSNDGNDLSIRTQEFLSFPESNNIELQELFDGNFGQRSLEEVLAFLQSWCFLGLLRHTMWISGIDVADENLITEAQIYGADAKIRYSEAITTSILPSLRAEVEAKSRSVRAAPLLLRATYVEFSTCLVTVMRLIRDLNLASEGNPLLADDSGESTEPQLRDSIMLSIYLLGDFLHYVLMLWLPPDMEPEEPDWTYLQLFPFLRKRMLRSGWCPSEVNILSDQPVGISTLLYLSFIDRRTLGKNHTVCAHLGRFECKYENLDRYETQHVSTCSERRANDFVDIMEHNRQIVQEAVALRDIPVVTVYGAEDNDLPGPGSLLRCSRESLRIQIQTWTERCSPSTQPEYVAFSHVWSE